MIRILLSDFKLVESSLYYRNVRYNYYIMFRRLQMKASIITLLVLLFTIQVYAYEVVVPNMPAGMCFKDLNSDGYSDIILGHRTTWGSTSPNISLLLNDGFGRFTVVDTSITSCGYQDYPILQDLNNDGDTDLITMTLDFSTGVIIRYFRIYPNIGLGNHSYTDYQLQRNGTIKKWICFEAPDSSHYIGFICNQQSYWGGVHINDSGQLMSQTYYDVSTSPQDINLSDVDNNGYLDVVIQYPHSIGLWLGYAEGFDQTDVPGQVLADSGLFIDLENNGAREYVTLYKRTFPYTVISPYIINVDSTNQLYYFFVDQTAVYPQAGDIDNDGFEDLIYNSALLAPLHTSDLSHSWVIKNESGILDSLPTSYYTGYDSYMSFIKDVNNDGWNDILTSNCMNPGKVHVLYNDTNGNFVESSPTSILDNNTEYAKPMISCYPNPFSDFTTFNLKNLPWASQTTLDIYNIKGQKVKSIRLSLDSESEFKVVWDGTDNDNKPISNGVYLCCLSNGNKHTKVSKIIKMR